MITRFAYEREFVGSVISAVAHHITTSVFQEEQYRHNL